MKLIRKLLIVSIGLLLTIPQVKAVEVENFNFEAVNGMKIAKIEYNNLSSEKAIIKISKDNQNGVIYRKRLQPDEKLSKYFDFSTLEPGVYDFTILTNKGSKEKKLLVRDNSVEVINNPVIRTPYFSYKEDMVTLSFINNYLYDFTIEIVDKNWNTVYSEDYENQISYCKRFNLDKLPSGRYIVVVTIGKETFSYDIFR